MENQIKQSVFAGIAGTAVMTMVMFIAPFMGMPKMSPPDMLAGMMGLPLVMGWVMHFMIGIIFAVAYVYIFKKLLQNIQSKFLKGSIFGLAVFVFAQIMMAVMSAIMPTPLPEGSIIMLMMGSIIGHIIYGIVVALIAKD